MTLVAYCCPGCRCVGCKAERDWQLSQNHAACRRCGEPVPSEEKFCYDCNLKAWASRPVEEAERKEIGYPEAFAWIRPSGSRRVWVVSPLKPDDVFPATPVQGGDVCHPVRSLLLRRTPDKCFWVLIIQHPPTRETPTIVALADVAAWAPLHSGHDPGGTQPRG